MQAQKMISEDRKRILKDDLEMIRDSIDGFGSYRFSDDLIARMTLLGISASELARKCKVSHSAIGKWRSGGAKPVGKERVKEVGLALSLTESELDRMLLAMGYAGLYEKNPLDNACIFTIRQGKEDPVGFYRNIVEQFCLEELAPSPSHKSLPTSEIRKSFAHIYTESSFGDWLKRYADSFSAFSKTILPNKELILYALLFLGGSSINEMYETGELPVTIRNLLYPLVAGGEISQKGLREKLIGFGLFRNMPEEEIDRLLTLAKLRPFSRPETKSETAVLTAVRCAHSRYAVYECEVLSSVCAILCVLLENEGSESAGKGQTESAFRRRTFYTDLLEELLPRLDLAERLKIEYEKPGRKNKDDVLFEAYYTDAGASCLAAYVKDVLGILVEGNSLESGDAERMIELLQLS